MSTTSIPDSATARLVSLAGLSDRLLARRLFDNGRRQREHRHQWRSVLELMAGEGDDPLYFEFRHRQLTEIVDDLVWLEAEAGSISAEIARRRQTGGAR